LVLVWGDQPAAGNHRAQVSATDVADVRSGNHSFDEVATYNSWQPTLAGNGDPERVPGMRVGDGYFRVLKATPALGRLFVPDDQVDGNDRVVVLGYSLWQRRFGGNPNVVGSSISLNSRNYTVVGVLAADVPSLPATLVGTQAEIYRPV